MADWFYRCGRALLDQTIRLYYRDVEVVGRERVPLAGPAILVANHPNSTVDAFLLATQLTDRKVNFIAKDTITRHPLYGWLVRRFGLVGVARGMDYERQRDLSRQRNELAIATCTPRLLAGEVVAIFGEGISNDSRRLNMIRKGAMRFGYAAEKAADFELGLLWIPVGISYAAKQRFRSDVLIRVGEPFRLADVHPQPGEHEAETLQRGTARLQQSLESLLVNIEKDDLAALIDRLSDLLGAGSASMVARVARHQHVARTLNYFNATEPHRLVLLEQEAKRYQARLTRAGLSDGVVRQRHPAFRLWSSVVNVLTNAALMLPSLYGGINSFIPRWTAFLFRRFGRERLPSRDAAATPQLQVAREAFAGAIGGWVGATVAFPLQSYVVYRIVAARAGSAVGIGVAILYALTLIPSWHLFVRRRDVFREHLANLRGALQFLIHAGPALKLQRQRRRVQRQLRSLLAAYDRRGPPTSAARAVSRPTGRPQPELRESQ
jgi:glycerol-3-phosphate O-acyltransferase/dihydroxyacetone phosphate acyltransferase